MKLRVQNPNSSPFSSRRRVREGRGPGQDLRNGREQRSRHPARIQRSGHRGAGHGLDVADGAPGHRHEGRAARRPDPLFDERKLGSHRFSANGEFSPSRRKRRPIPPDSNPRPGRQLTGRPGREVPTNARSASARRVATQSSSLTPGPFQSGTRARTSSRFSSSCTCARLRPARTSVSTARERRFDQLAHGTRVRVIRHDRAVARHDHAMPARPRGRAAPGPSAPARKRRRRAAASGPGCRRRTGCAARAARWSNRSANSQGPVPRFRSACPRNRG